MGATFGELLLITGKLRGALLDARDVKRELGALSQLGLDTDEAVMTVDDLLGHGKPHAKSAAHALSAGQKRLKTRARASLAMPMPVSATDTRTSRPSCDTLTTT